MQKDHAFNNKPIGLEEIDLIPDRPGVYAWYYRIFVPDFDLQKLRGILETESIDVKKLAVRDFLNRHMFNPFQETPYHVSIRGALKPVYEGHVPNVRSISESLLMRLVSQPDSIERLCRLLRSSVPLFASPIYIGISSSLKRRLQHHKKLMLAAKEDLNSLKNHQDLSLKTEEDRLDHQFATEVVVQRGINPSDLCVYCMLTEDVGGRADALNAENILNRINYPLCGRN